MKTKVSQLLSFYKQSIYFKSAKQTNINLKDKSHNYIVIYIVKRTKR